MVAKVDCETAAQEPPEADWVSRRAVAGSKHRGRLAGSGAGAEAKVEAGRKTAEMQACTHRDAALLKMNNAYCRNTGSAVSFVLDSSVQHRAEHDGRSCNNS